MRSRWSPIASLGWRDFVKDHSRSDPRLQRPGSSGWDLCREHCGFDFRSARLSFLAQARCCRQGASPGNRRRRLLNHTVQPRELVARRRALMRRASRISPESLYVFEDVIVDFPRPRSLAAARRSRSLQRNSRRWSSWQKNAERVISRGELLNEVWGYQKLPLVLERWDNHILKLRQKLESDSLRTVTPSYCPRHGL
jgi:hypothetical protein